MPRGSPAQAQLPHFEANGMTHAPSCRCPRCQGWLDRESVRQAAAATLARRREKQRVKALALALDLAEDERRTNAYLAEQAKLLEGLRHDERLDALLASRGAGRPANEAIAEVERRFSAPSQTRRSGGR